VLFPSSFTETVNGRSYDGVHGFVDVTTPTQLSFGSINQLFPDSGELLLTGAPEGAGNRTIRVTVQSPLMARLQLDLTGDGAPDNTAFLKWTELTGPVGADLGDDDGDTMHNSWETQNALDPNVNDAAGDNDGDMINNVTEYQNGTDPNAP
jgi:hypothetical protein